MRVSVFVQSLETAMTQRALLDLFCFYLYGEVPRMISVVVPVKHGNKTTEAKNEWHCCDHHWNTPFILFIDNLKKRMLVRLLGKVDL